MKQTSEERREQYIQSLSEQERMMLFILHEIGRLQVVLSHLDRRVLKVLATLKETSILKEGTEATHEDMEYPIIPSVFNGMAFFARETFHLDNVAEYVQMSEEKQVKRGRPKKRNKSGSSRRKGSG